VLALEDAGQRRLLLGVGLVVDEEDLLPIAGQHVARQEGRRGQRQAGDRDLVDCAALVEMVGERRLAGAVIRILADPARTQDVAIAHLEQASLEVIAHGFTLPREARGQAYRRNGEGVYKGRARSAAGERGEEMDVALRRDRLIPGVAVDLAVDRDGDAL